jgi:hypothetical protein
MTIELTDALGEAERGRALHYPYQIPPTHFAIEPNAHKLHLMPDLRVLDFAVADRRGGATFYDVSLLLSGAEQHLANVCPVVAAGSNASHEQLNRKFHTHSRNTIYSLLGRFSNVVPIYSAHLASYGAIPACLWPCEGAESWLFFTFFAADDLERMHATESLGEHYRFSPLPAAVRGPIELGTLEFYFYESLLGPVLSEREQPIALASFDVRSCDLPRMSERDLLPLAFAELFPDRPFDVALAGILGSREVRAAAMDRLKAIRIPLPRDEAQAVR